MRRLIDALVFRPMRIHTSMALTGAALLSLAACASSHHTTVVVPSTHPASAATTIPVPTHIATITPVATTAAPMPSHKASASASVIGLCHIRTAKGACFSAGQFCPAATAGRTTTDPANRPITCTLVKGHYIWKLSKA